MAHMNLNCVEPRTHAVLSRSNKVINHVLHIVLSHPPPQDIAPKKTRRIKARDRTLQTLRHKDAGYEGPTVRNLSSNLATLGVHSIGYRSQFIKHTVVQPNLIR